MKRIIFLAATLLLAATASFAQQIPNLPNDPAYRQGKLDNGLTYYIRHNDKPAQRAEFYLATHAGALQEAPDQDGLAHFLEHMCFNGTKNFPGKGILNWLESIGASFGGNVNASTGVEQTVYLLNNIPLIRPTVVDTCLLIMHDYSHFVTCDPAEIDAERGVILEEKRTRNTSSWRIMEKSFKVIFGDTKYATTTIIGSEENLKTFKPESLVNFYQTWYHPGNQALIVVGDIDVDEVEQKIKDTFADIPAKENPQAKPVYPIPDNKEPIVDVITDPEAPTASFSLIWKSKPMPAAYKSTQLGLMNDLLADIFYYAAAERLGDIAAKSDAPFVQASLIANTDLCESADASVFGSVVTKDGAPMEGLDAILLECEKIKRFGFSDGEIDRAKAMLLSDKENQAKRADTRKNSEFVYPCISNFFENRYYMDPAQEYEISQALLGQLNNEIINQALKGAFTDENLIVYYSGPEKEGATPTKEQIAQAIAMAREAEIAAPAGEEIPTQFLDPASLKGSKIKSSKQTVYGATQWILKNGVTVILKPTDLEKNKIDIELYKKGGRSLIETADLPTFEENMWYEYQGNSGIGDFSATMTRKMLAGKTISYYPFINAYTHGVYVNTAPQDLEMALQLFYLQFTQPRFDKDEYDQGIRQIEAILPNIVKQPSFIFQDRIYKTSYQSDRKPFISEDVLKRSSIETLERVMKQQLFDDAAGAVVTIIGDFDIEQMKPLVEKYIGSLPKGKKADNWEFRNDGYVQGIVIDDFKAKMQTPKVSVTQLYNVDKKYSVESDVAFDALSYILDMVYVETLREEEGGTYGASTYCSTRKAPYENVMLQIFFDTNVELADKLREIAKKGLTDIAENGPSADKFDKTVKNLEKTLPESRIRNSYWKSCIHNYTMYGLEIDQAREAAIKALTPEKVQAAAAELLASGNFVEIIMRPEE